MEPLSLRAHHINSAKLLSKVPREKIVEVMQQLGYIENSSEPFVDVVYSTLEEHFQDPSNEVTLTVGGLDIICENCKKNKEGTCEPNRIGEYDILLSPNCGKDADRQVLERYNLEKERVYTVGEVKKAANF